MPELEDVRKQNENLQNALQGLESDYKAMVIGYQKLLGSAYKFRNEVSETMKVNQLWDQDAVTMGDLQETVDKLETLQVRATGRKVRSPLPMKSCYVTYQPAEGLYKVSYGTANSHGHRSSHHAVVYEYRLSKNFLKCDYDQHVYPATTTLEPCEHILAVLSYRESTSN